MNREDHLPGAQPELHSSLGIRLLSNPNLPFPPGFEDSSNESRGRRGRPRKNDLGLTPSTHPGALRQTEKRGRGRPPGSGRKQPLTIGEMMPGSAGSCFTPHVITIATGEDIETKIAAFSQQGPRAVCILSANGFVSRVTLRQSSTSGGTVTYEGNHEILSLTGSYVLIESGNCSKRTGGLSVTVLTPDCRIIGGGVCGSLIAASPIQLIVGSFIWKKKEEPEEGDVAGESDDQAVQSLVVSPIQAVQASSSMSQWRGARQMDMRNSPVDIDLTRR